MGIKQAHDVPPFVRYCSAIIPTMFDDSLSYYEALCALNNFIQKNIVEVINNNATVTQEYIDLTNQLKEYMENYFENLDVQEEINNKLDEMVINGELGSIITGYVEPYLSQTNIKVNALENDVNSLKMSYGAPLKASTVSQMTNTNRIYVYIGSESGYISGHWYYYDNNEWVDGGVYQSSAVETDKALTTLNTPADALYTGLLKNSVSKPYDTIVNLLVNKIRDNTTGAYTNSSKRLTTSTFVRFNEYVLLVPPTGYRVGLWCKTDPSDEESESITALRWATDSITILPDIDYIVAFTKTDTNENISLSEMVNFTIKYGASISKDDDMPKFIDYKYQINLNYMTQEGEYFIGNWFQNNNEKFEPVNTPENLNSNFVIYNTLKYRAVGIYYITQRIWYFNLGITYERLLNQNGTVRIEWYKVSPFDSIKKGKKLSIYGDSISTYAGWIPTGNATWYTGNNAGIDNVNKTWWKEVIDALQYDLLVNNSWSGRAVSSIRDSMTGHTTDAAYKQSNIDVLGSNGTPEEIIIKLGINDFISGCPLGTYTGETPINNSADTFTDAYALMLYRIMTTYPLAKVYCCTLPSCERIGDLVFPERNSNGDSLVKWNNSIKQIASSFGAEVIDQAECGLTYFNLSTYMADYSSDTGRGLHPNADGMTILANYTIDKLDNAVRKRF